MVVALVFLIALNLIVVRETEQLVIRIKASPRPLSEGAGYPAHTDL